MRKHFKLLTVVCTLVVCAFGTLMARPRALDAPLRYQPSSHDRQLVQVANPVNGQNWSVWTFRNGAEYDIALSVAGEDGIWSEPVFLGRDDNRDQVDPAIAIHESGAVVVAFAEPDHGRILVSSLAPGGRGWTRPLPVAEAHDARSPALLIFGDRLVLAFRTGEQVRIVDLRLNTDSASPRTINDGPDPVGVKDGDDSDDSDDSEEEEDQFEGASKSGRVTVVDTRRD